MSRNRVIAEAFAAEFTPPLVVAAVERINNVPHRDAWMAASMDEATGYGITAHAFAGQLHAYVEMLATGPDSAASAGRIMAATMSRARDEWQQMAEGPQDTGQRTQEGDAE